MQSNSKILLAVGFNDEANQYTIDISSGSNVAETAFCMAVVIKCLLKDGYIDSPNSVLDLINKYLEDPQYAEVEDIEDAEGPLNFKEETENEQLQQDSVNTTKGI